MAKKKDLSPFDLDLIQCEKDGFGCHYGKWKPWHDAQKAAWEKPTNKTEPDLIVKRICENCGIEFVRNDNRPCKYCGDECRVAANYKVIQERKHNNGKA